MAKLLTVGTGEHIFYWIVFVVPGAVSFFAAFISCIGENRDFSIIQSLLCNPRGLISRVHGHELNIKFAGYIVIYLIPCHTVMDISGSYLYSQNETSFVTSRMRFVGKLPLMLSFYEHSTIRVCGGNGLFYGFPRASTTLGMIFIIVIFNGLLAQLFSFRVNLSAKLP